MQHKHVNADSFSSYTITFLAPLAKKVFEGDDSFLSRAIASESDTEKNGMGVEEDKSICYTTNSKLLPLKNRTYEKLTGILKNGKLTVKDLRCIRFNQFITKLLDD